MEKLQSAVSRPITAANSINIYIYNVCVVTLSVYPHRASLKNMPDHGGNRTYDLWNTSPMLCQLSYAVRTRFCSEISLTRTVLTS